MTIRPAVRALLIYLVVQTVVVVGVFLQVAGFFDSWNGQMAGVLQPRGTSPLIYEVVIAEPDGSSRVENMPSEVVLGLGLPVLAGGRMNRCRGGCHGMATENTICHKMCLKLGISRRGNKRDQIKRIKDCLKYNN